MSLSKTEPFTTKMKGIPESVISMTLMNLRLKIRQNIIIMKVIIWFLPKEVSTVSVK